MSAIQIIDKENIVTISTQESWNQPQLQPLAIGEYKAALDPSDVSILIRRWWDGRQWSNPYSADWPESVKQRCRLEASPFIVYWQ